VHPKIFIQSTDDSILNSLVACISQVSCSDLFSIHIGKSQPEQRKIVISFQNRLLKLLKELIPEINWFIEHCPSSENKDSIDIFGEGGEFVVVIELDKNRADQVAKKFVSRVALLPNKSFYYISLCYPGTERMNRAECIKYFKYCSILAVRMKNHYAGFIIQSKAT
jgi:hypothetical protein